MTDKKLLGINEKHNYDLAVKYLDIVLLAPQTVKLLKDDNNFDQIINRAINIVSYYEENYETPTSNETKFKQAYRALTHKEVSPDPDFKYSDANEVLDSINYIGVFIKNITGLTWEELEKSLKGPEADKKEEKEEEKTAKEPKDEDEVVDAKRVDNPNDYAQQSYSQNAGFNFNTSAGSYYGSGAYQNDLAETIIAQQATMMLNMNIISGKVYQYKTKPLIIPILKYLMISVFILMSIITIVSFALLMYVSRHTALYVPNTSVSAGYTAVTSWASAFPFQMIFFLIVTAMALWSIIQTLKNDNYKYRFSILWTSIYVGTLLFITFIQSGVNNEMIFNYNGFLGVFDPSKLGDSVANSIYPNNPQAIEFISGKNGSYIGYIDAIRGLQFTLYALLILSVIIIITAAVFNPKKDFERLQMLVQQYADDIRYGRVNPDDFDSGNSFFGSKFGTWF